MRLIHVLCLAALAALSGCSSLNPIPVSDPSPTVLDPKTNKQVRRTADHTLGGLSPATNKAEAVENLKIYADWYQKKAEDLKTAEYQTNDGSLAGGVLGVIGGVTKSVQTAVLGAGVAGGSSMVASRYQLVVQSQNYMKASDAMHCMYTKASEEADVDIDHKFVNGKIFEVTRKLRKSQFDINLVSPDLGALQNRLKDLAEKKDQSSAAQARLSSASRVQIAANDPDKANKEQELKAAQQAAKEAKAKELEAELNKCVAAF